MFRSISLTDFQSHRKTELDLGPFTVIVGSSSSGKSAIVRAIRLVAENARGTSYVRQGEKSCSVALTLVESVDVVDASAMVVVERGKSVSSYELRSSDSETPSVFTKCSSSVPDAVSAALGLGDPRLWLAGQFDRPFLLDETGAEVARVLGKLTNVTMIYAAVRETNRRASEARRSHSASTQSLTEVTEAIQKYDSLPVRLLSAREAESSLAVAEAANLRLTSLADRIGDARSAEDRVCTARSLLRPVPDVSRLLNLNVWRARLVEHLASLAEVGVRLSEASVAQRHIPDTRSFDSLLTKRASLRQLIISLRQADNDRVALSKQVKVAGELVQTTKQNFNEALHDAGKCPLCGAPSVHAQIESVL